MGYTGAQLADSEGVQVGQSEWFFKRGFIEKLSGTTAKPTQEYKYLDGRCRHYKLIGQ